jgi:quercetin dioxygenase-like cupin family protein
MKVARGRVAGAPSVQRGETFTGSVWSDPVLRTEDGVIVNTVFFPPGVRTNWHTHERGQLLVVTHGSGLVEVRDGEVSRVGPGDVVHFAPGELHWHGATSDGYLMHVAISLGRTDWLEPVSAEQFEQAEARA